MPNHTKYKTSVKVRKYDLIVDKDIIVPKLDVLFAFPFSEYETIKAGIKLNKQVEAQKLQPIQKQKDRPIVATNQEYENGTDKEVRITMRSGHVPYGKQVTNTEYNLILRIADKCVLIYKHGIHAYRIEASEA